MTQKLKDILFQTKDKMIRCLSHLKRNTHNDYQLRIVVSFLLVILTIVMINMQPKKTIEYRRQKNTLETTTQNNNSESSSILENLEETQETTTQDNNSESSSILENLEKTQETTTQNEKAYNGFPSKEIEKLGFQLELVENPNDMIEGFDGKIYTHTFENSNLEKGFNAVASIGGESLNLKKINSFSSLENNKLFSKSSDLNGDSYSIDQNGQVKFFTRGIQSVLIENGDIFYVFIVNINDYQYCKELQINLLNGITIDSTITDLFHMLGDPKCIDVYEATNEKPYILCYYTKEQNNKKTSELSFVFVYDENAKNGYYLSEVTISMIESN